MDQSNQTNLKRGSKPAEHAWYTTLILSGSSPPPWPELLYILSALCNWLQILSALLNWIVDTHWISQSFCPLVLATIHPMAGTLSRLSYANIQLIRLSSLVATVDHSEIYDQPEQTNIQPLNPDGVAGVCTIMIDMHRVRPGWYVQ